MCVHVSVGHCVCPNQTNSTVNMCWVGSESSFNTNFFIIRVKRTIEKSPSCQVDFTGNSRRHLLFILEKRSHGAHRKNQTPECLHTSTSLRLIIQINTSLFIKWNLSLFTVNRGVCMHSPRCKTHTDTDAHTESANERRRCVFLLPDGVWASKYTHTQALLSLCVCVCVLLQIAPPLWCMNECPESAR